jgi:acyl-CoA thioester hydrolase
MVDAAVAHSIHEGYSPEDYRRLGQMWVVRRHQVDYHKPAFAGDELICATWTTLLKAATCERQHEVRRISDDAVIARGMNKWAYVDARLGRPIRVSAEMAAAFDPARFA